MRENLNTFIDFCLKSAQCCIFAIAFFILLSISHLWPESILPRYDFIFIGALLIQYVLWRTKFETGEEILGLCLFHLAGFGLEVFKVHPSIGSWSYPEFGYTKILDVPLYSGFMYAAVASSMYQARKVFNLRLQEAPPKWICLLTGVTLFTNFFTHHLTYDYRWILLGVSALLFFRTQITLKFSNKLIQKPLPLLFLFFGFLVWIAENISTLLGAWKYPDQVQSWTMVSFSKIVSWTILAIFCFVLTHSLIREEA